MGRVLDRIPLVGRVWPNVTRRSRIKVTATLELYSDLERAKKTKRKTKEVKHLGT